MTSKPPGEALPASDARALGLRAWIAHAVLVPQTVLFQERRKTMLTDLLRSARARLLGAPRARGRRGTPAPTFRPAVEPLDERCLPSGVTSPAQLSALHLQPGHLAVLRAFQKQLHLGPLYATLPDLGAGQTAAAPNTFVGPVAGTNLFVAVVVGPQEALAFVCDGTGTHDWLRGPVQGSALTLAGTTRSAQGDQIAAQVQGDALSGTVTLHGGTALPFTASRAADGQSGLFRSPVRVGRQEFVLSLIPNGNAVRGGVSFVKIVSKG
jgi:hypothetical protein